MASFIDLRPGNDMAHWTLPVEERLCVGPPGQQFLFGGVGLATAVQALQRSCERRVIWAAAQYVSYARPGSTVEWTVAEYTRGKFNTQASATGRVGDQLIISVNAALGSRPSEFNRQWLVAPDVLPPERSQPVIRSRGEIESLHYHLDTRIAETPGGEVRLSTEDGRVLLWIKPHDNVAIDAEMLAIMADFVPMGVGRALGTNRGGNSLDNTIRIHQVIATEWVLGDLQISAVHDGFGHGTMSLFAQTGELMATAGQSLIIRKFPDEPR
jgi:acyl-CoA thioesterase